MNMLVVTDIAVRLVDREEVIMSFFDGHAPMDGASVTREMIVGKPFVNVDGVEVCIGMSSQAQSALGLPFSVFEQQNRDISLLRTRLRTRNMRISVLEGEIKEIRCWGFLDRLIFLFRGIRA